MNKPPLTFRLLHILLLFPAVLISCGEGDREAMKRQYVARVGEDRLFRDELKRVIPEGISKKDSQELAQDHIHNWITERILLREANDRLKEEQKDLEERVRKYRQSLLINMVQESVVREKLNNKVTQDQVQEFYIEHKREFKAGEPIVKLKGVKLARDSIAYLSKARVLLRERGEEDSLKEVEFCENHASDCLLNDQKWYRIEDLRERLAIKNGMDLSFENSGPVQFEQDNYIYYLNVRRISPADSAIPLDLIREKVRRMILNKRRKAIVDSFREKAILNAREKNYVEIY